MSSSALPGAFVLRPPSRAALVYAGTVAVLALTYFGAAQLGLALASGPSTASAVWPPAGIAVAALVLLGVRMWPGVLIGALLAEVTSGVPTGSALAITAGNTLEALVAWHLLVRVARFDHALRRVRDVVALGGAAVAGSVIGAAIGATSLWLGGVVPLAAAGNVWTTWLLGDIGGMLIVAPCLLVAAAGGALRWRRATAVEAAALLAVLAVACELAFSGPQRLLYLVFAVLIWAAVRFQAAGAAATSFIAAAVSLSFAARELGPFAAGTASEGVLASQFFMTIMALGGLLLAAVVSERETALRELRTAQAQLEEKVRERTAALATANAHLRSLASHDGLTGLANRTRFFELLDHALALARRYDLDVAVLFVDIDGFKACNDRYGHHAGDEVLVEAARRLQGAVRQTDTVARLGGDEFAILLAGSTTPAQAAGTAERVLEYLRLPFSGATSQRRLSASVGVAVRPASAGDEPGHELLRRADAAMYQAKTAGGNRYELFDAASTLTARPAARPRG